MGWKLRVYWGCGKFLVYFVLFIFNLFVVPQLLIILNAGMWLHDWSWIVWLFHSPGRVEKLFVWARWGACVVFFQWLICIVWVLSYFIIRYISWSWWIVEIPIRWWMIFLLNILLLNILLEPAHRNCLADLLLRTFT